jgi:hypothetical protein
MAGWQTTWPSPAGSPRPQLGGPVSNSRQGWPGVSVKMPVLAPSWKSAWTPAAADADGVKSAMAQFTLAAEVVCSEPARIPATDPAGRCRPETEARTSVPALTVGGVLAAAAGAIPSASDPASTPAPKMRMRARLLSNRVTVLCPLSVTVRGFLQCGARPDERDRPEASNFGDG